MRSLRISYGVLIASASAVLVGNGCKVGPDYVAPATTMPSAYASTQPTTAPTTQAAQDARLAAMQLAAWWRTFDDPMLSSLVEEATAANLDVRIATSRIRQARAQRGVVSSTGQPQANADAGYTRSRSSQTLTGTPSGGSSSGSTQSDFWTAGFDASWELDVFGGLKRATEAADVNIQVSVEDGRDVLVSVQAEVARTYTELRGAQLQLEVTRNNIRAQGQTLEIAKSRFAAGVVSEVDVARAEAQVSTTAAQIPTFTSIIRQSIYRLSVLLAKQPNELSDRLTPQKPLPIAPMDIPAGQPGELLRRRPDIRRTERQLAAATAQIGAAKSDLYPKFSLIGSAGRRSIQFGHWWDGDSNFWSIGPQMSWAILNGGRVKSNIEIQNAVQEQANLVFQRTVLLAVEEVEDSLTGYAQEQRRLETLQAAVKANRRAVELAREQYTRGLTDFTTVLDAQRAQYATDDLLVQSQRAVVTNAIAVYKALGGGWMPREQLPTTQP